MKTTFLVGLPRCGSLALSKMMDTKDCIAHHEGNDYEVVFNNNIKFFDTYAGKAWLDARKAGKNYFCCDISCSLHLIVIFMEAIVEGLVQCDLDTEFNIVFVNTDPNDTVKSLMRMCRAASYEEIYYRDVVSVEMDKIHYMLNKQGPVSGLNILTVKKEGKRFSDDQLTEISKTVGTSCYYNYQSPISWQYEDFKKYTAKIADLKERYENTKKISLDVSQD